ncbi:MAG: transcriptional regulator [Acidimicrobiales bacterium]
MSHGRATTVGGTWRPGPDGRPCAGSPLGSFIRLGRFDQAEHVTASALAALAPIATGKDASPEVLSLYGAMHLVQAVISGHESDRARARSHLADATRVAQQLGQDRHDFDAEFGPTNVQLHTVAVAVDLARRRRRSPPGRTRHRRLTALTRTPARLLIDVARAHAQRRHAGEAVSGLLDAERLGPEHVRSHHLAKATVKDLLDQFGRRPPADLMDLARRCGSAP